MIYTSDANCSMCSHFRGNRTCDAFTDGIPDELWEGKNLHRSPYQGDNGITFSAKPIIMIDMADFKKEQRKAA